MSQEMGRSEKRRRNRKIRTRVGFGMLAAVSLAAVLYSGAQLLGYYKDYQREMALEEELLQMRKDAEGPAVTAKADADAEETGFENTPVEKTTEQLRSFYHMMKEKNEDYVCWITLEGAGVDYPVVKRDNSFYLSHDFAGEPNRHGAVFLDQNCQADSDVLLLHAHHMKDGTMFGGLKKFKDREFCEENREIVLEFEEKYERYRVFAAAQVDLTAEGSFAFEMIPETAEEKTLYIEGLNRTSFWYDESVIGKNAENACIVILSTCDYGTDDERLLVAAKKIE